MPVKFATVVHSMAALPANKSAPRLKDETDYTPRSRETANYRLGLLHKTLDNTWGQNTSKKVLDKLQKSGRWDMSPDVFKNVICTFGTQVDDKDPEQTMHICKVTFSFMATIVDPVADERKEIKKYQSWLGHIVGFMKKDAEDEFGGSEITFTDMTKKLCGKDVMVNCVLCNSSTPNVSTVGRLQLAQTTCKKLFTITKIYKIDIKG